MRRTKEDTYNKVRIILPLPHRVTHRLIDHTLCIFSETIWNPQLKTGKLLVSRPFCCRPFFVCDLWIRLTKPCQLKKTEFSMGDFFWTQRVVVLSSGLYECYLQCIKVVPASTWYLRNRHFLDVDAMQATPQLIMRNISLIKSRPHWVFQNLDPKLYLTGLRSSQCYRFEESILDAVHKSTGAKLTSQIFFKNSPLPSKLTYSLVLLLNTSALNDL